MDLTYVIPCFNGMPYVLEAVASCLKQATEYRVEVVLIDDGSTDGSADSVSRHFKAVENLRIVRQANTGESGAINSGLKHAAGNFICVLSADDLVDENHAQLTVGLALAAGIEVVYPDWKRINEDGDILERVSTTNFKRSRLWDEFTCIPGPGAIIARRVIGDSLRPGKFRYIDDYAQWLVLSSKADFIRLKASVASWRHHASQATQNSNGLISIEQWKLIDMVANGVGPFTKNTKLAEKMAASLWVLQTISKVQIPVSAMSPPKSGRKLVAFLRFSLRNPLHVVAFFLTAMTDRKEMVRRPE